MNAIIRFIGDPILAFLVWLYEVIPSLGVGIVILTVVINTLLFPLVLKQTRATKAFQKIGPEIKKLQELHKDEPQTLQTEMVKLQRENGATPGGCLLPMLVQLPIWWALFQVLRDLEGAAENPRFAPPAGSSLAMDLADGNAYFFGNLFGDGTSGWLDLTATPSIVFANSPFVELVPYLLLVLAMVGAQFFAQLVQQRYNERGNAAIVDTPQAKQMRTLTKVMPVMFGVFAWNFVAGLTVYWTASSLVRLGQQQVINRMDDAKEARAASPSTPPPPSDENSADPEKPKRAQGSAKKQQRRRRRRT